MEDRIKELIELQKTAKEEAQHILDTIKYLTDEDIVEIESEISLRNSFISDLEDILSPEERINNIEVRFDETQDKF